MECLRIAGLRMTGLISAITLAAGLLSTTPAQALPSFDQSRAQWQSSDATLLDRHGEPLQRMRVDNQARRLQWVPLPEVSHALQRLLIRSEDQRFFEHAGVDWQAMAKAAQQLGTGASGKRGASTLTMQLAGLLDASLERPATGRGPLQKTAQALAALKLERQWSKAEILEAYLNYAPFRGEWVGIAAASQLLFGREARALNDRESALLVAMLRAPNASPSQIAARACRLLDEGADVCAILPVMLTQALAQRASHEAQWAHQLAWAPHYARRVNNTKPQLTKPQPAKDAPAQAIVRSTLDATTQRIAVTALDQQLSLLATRGAQDGAVVVLDNRTGEVLAWVGSSGQHSNAPQVDMVQSPRQTGSLLKPFVYGLAIEQGLLTAASVLDDSSLDLSTAAGQYIPQNYDRRFKGPVTVRTALGSSLNIPAVRALSLVGFDPFYSLMQQLQVKGLKSSGGFYGYSMALGSIEIDLLTLTQAYRGLANGSVFSPATAFIVSDILADREARVLSFGRESVLSTRYWSAVKTGTSKDMRDNWCIGYSELYTVGVWVGNAAGEPMRQVSGISGAAPVWATVMNHLHQSTPSRAPSPPSGVVQQFVSVQTIASRESDRKEWFRKGTEQTQWLAASSQDQSLMIQAPAAGVRFAIDPDIPPQAQRITLIAKGQGAQNAQWRVNQQIVGRGAQVFWSPLPGSHAVELWSSGQRVASHRIEVVGLRR
jgi:penicillin-binding protein 1C